MAITSGMPCRHTVCERHSACSGARLAKGLVVPSCDHQRGESASVVPAQMGTRPPGASIGPSTSNGSNAPGATYDYNYPIQGGMQMPFQGIVMPGCP